MKPLKPGRVRVVEFVEPEAAVDVVVVVVARRLDVRPRLCCDWRE